MEVDDRKKKADAASGKNKANRQAQIAQKRGLQESGKATPKEVKKASLKAGGGGAANAAKNAKNAKNTASGLPKMLISFNPKHLSVTTDVNVRNQILGVLSKAPKQGDVRRPQQERGPKPKSRSVKASK